MQKAFGLRKNLASSFFALLFVVLGCISFSQLPNLEKAAFQRDNILAQRHKIETDYKDQNRIFFYGSSSKRYALFFGNLWANKYHSNMLETIYGKNIFFFEHNPKQLSNWRNENIQISSLINKDIENTIIVGVAKRKQIEFIERILKANRLELIDKTPDSRFDHVFEIKRRKNQHGLSNGREMLVFTEQDEV